MLPELSLWKCQRWNPPIQWCTNSSECFPSRRRLPNVTGAIVIALKTQKKPAVCAPSADGNVTRHQTLHHPKLYIKQFFIKSFHTKSKWHKSRQVKTQRMEGKKKKKKIKKKKKKIRLSTEETGKWLTSWAYVLIQTHCPCRTITIHLTDILVGRFVLEYQDRLGDAELQQAITQRYHNTK